MYASTPEYAYVQPGDTLSSIAERDLGNADFWPELYRANESEIANPNLIYPGQRLKLPSRHAGSPVVAAEYKPKHSSGYQPQHSSGKFSGTLSCSGLEQLWMSAGGSPSEAFTAAEIAMAESGGNQFATGAAGERGYWQINPDHGNLSTYDPEGNARAAVIISFDGTNWTAWTTYTSGAYEGRC